MRCEGYSDIQVCTDSENIRKRAVAEIVRPTRNINRVKDLQIFGFARIVRISVTTP